MSRFGLRGVLAVLGGVSLAFCVLMAAESSLPVVRVPQIEDFELTGDGGADAWSRAQWVDLRKRPGSQHDYFTRIKVLWSTTGVYCLMEGSDELVTATFQDDFEDLWTEDVFEVFLWPDERDPLYFEYEISPLGKELPILIPNLEGRFLGWRPWHYEGNRKTRKKTSVIGNRLESGATIKGWKAEVFIPFELMRPLRGTPPKKGQKWRANFYRVDHDKGRRSSWDWAPVESNFHDFEHYGTLIFD